MVKVSVQSPKFVTLNPGGAKPVSFDVSGTELWTRALALCNQSEEAATWKMVEWMVPDFARYFGRVEVAKREGAAK